MIVSIASQDDLDHVVFVFKQRKQRGALGTIARMPPLLVMFQIPAVRFVDAAESAIRSAIRI